MTVDQLKKYIEGLPGDAIVYVVADHGQMPEMARGIDISDYSGELPYYADDEAVFVHPDDREGEVGTVTAVLIG